jgi:hypothetical protein
VAQYIALDASWKPAVTVVADVAMLVLLWFMVGLGLLLRRVDGEVPIRWTMATLSGVLVAAYVVTTAVMINWALDRRQLCLESRHLRPRRV